MKKNAWRGWGVLRSGRGLRRVLGVALTAWGVAGCASYRGDPRLMELTSEGRYGAAREVALARAETNPRSRGYLLDREKVLVLSVAEGVPEAAEGLGDYVYDQLRTQGLNADKTVATFLLSERGVRIWKGEPFEQALAYTTLAVLDGMLGEWGNMRASASGSIFQLRDLSQAIAAEEAAREEDSNAPPLSEDEQVRRRELAIAAMQRQEAERDEEEPGEAEDGTELGIDYSLTASDFELGYVLKAIAERHLGYPELQQTLDQLTDKAPRLRDFAEVVRRGRYDTVLVVDYGLAPQKIATGMDGVIAAFEPRTPSDDNPLLVSVGGRTFPFPVVTDVNRLATDLKWNSLEDMRRAKSVIGTGLVIGGAAVAATADSWEQALAGLLIAGAGAAMKASAKVDTRHNEVFSQRTYVALLDLGRSPRTVELEIEGKPGSRVVLPAMTEPEGAEQMQLAYARLPSDGSSPGWATAGRVLYANDVTGPVSESPAVPYVLGGRCVRTPSRALAAEYRRAGLPEWFGYDELLQLYREEGILLVERANEGLLGRHVLEGGNALYTPRMGSVGFLRLYGQEHPPYEPRGPLAKRLLEEMHGEGKEAGLGRMTEVPQ